MLPGSPSEYNGLVSEENNKAFKFFPASGDFPCLLITSANSLNPDQAQQNIRPDLDPNCLDTLMVFLKDFFLKKKK